MYGRVTLEGWLQKIDIKTNSVLDVGGARKSILSRTKSWNVKEYRILDNHRNARGNHQIDYRYDLNEEFKIDKQFDVIFCTEVMQFLWNPIVALKNMARLLKQGGILYINFQFIVPNLKGTDYLRYTELGAKTFLEKAGFKIKDIYSSGDCTYIMAIRL